MTGGGSGGSGGGSSGTGGGGTGGGSGGTGGSGGGAATTGTFPDVTNGGNGIQPQLVIDASGTRHMLYELKLAPTGSTATPFRYGECSANCSRASSWQFTAVGDRGVLGGSGKLALTAQGKPRVIWAKADLSSAPTELHYASCESSCTTASSWTSGKVFTLASGATVYDWTGRNLAIDGTGRAHFIYPLNGLHYMTCASNCTAAASWSAPLKLVDFSGHVSLAATATGQVKVAFTTQFDPWLAYRTCEAGCDTLGNWAAEALLRPSNEGLVSLRLDGQGRPRLFYNQNGAGMPSSQDTYYGWCDSGCGVTTNWTFISIGLPSADGKRGLDFDLHSDGAVSGAMETSSGALATVYCPASCQSLAGAWLRSVVEDSDTLKAELSPPLPDCSNFMPPRTPYAFWYPGEQSSAAVNPATNKLEVAHRTYVLQKCGSGNTYEGLSIPRFSGPF